VDDKLDELVHRLMIEANDPGEIHTCPICDGVLHVRFQTYTRSGRDMLGVNTFCEKCKINIFNDYSLAEELPQWLKQK
jgi:hypothetical protein